MDSIKTGVLALMVLFLPLDLSFGQNTAKQIWTKGVEHAAQGHFNEAEEEFEKALKVDPHYVTAKEDLKVIKEIIDQKIKSKTAIGPNIFSPPVRAILPTYRNSPHRVRLRYQQSHIPV